MDRSAILPDGSSFNFWEKEPQFKCELFVDESNPEASDQNAGDREHPLKTIQAAADRAVPGTRIWIRGGVYRECVHPRRGGTDAEHLISYEAWPGEEVIISASEVVTDFVESTGWRKTAAFEEPVPESLRIWTCRLNPEMFKGYNPFCCVNILHDRLFIEYGKTDMTTYLNRRGMIFCDGKPLEQVPLYNRMSEKENTFWVEANGQTIHFRLKDGENPNDHEMEITVREQCFAPEEPFLSFICVKGLSFLHAATGAPVPQRGALSAFRGHHWIIEDCTVDWSNAVGIDVGNECWHHEIIEGQQIGFSVIRRCKILGCGVCGIAGLFAEELLVEDCLIQGTGWQKMELSWEAGGMKLHNSVNGLFRRNIFRDTLRADHLWLDCGNENNRITGNLFLNGIEQREAIFIECTRDGVNLIDNNIIWNVEGRFDPKQIPVEPGSSGWYKLREHDVVNGYAIYGEGTDHLRIVNNLIGKIRGSGYYAKPVSFRHGGMNRGGTSRDARVFNNIFFDCTEAAITFPTKDNQSEGNLFVNPSGGYLRVMYPEPELLLHLPAWKEFLNFDMTGQEAFFQIEVDDTEHTICFEKAEKKPAGLKKEIERRCFIYDPEKVKAVGKDPMVSCDFFGEMVNDQRVPGPLQSLKDGLKVSIDPRRLNQ